MNALNNDIKKIYIQAKNLPFLPGVYIFKNEADQILYIGKAKNLKKRVLSYFNKSDIDFKSNIITSESSKIDYIITKNELEAMLLEAQLIQSNQPKFNILLKSGQPFLYLLITSPRRKLPELKIVRNKKEKGTYFGPFLERIPTRKVYNFITKIFKLSLCKTKMESGCLEFHIGNCAGNCRSDFNKYDYLKRLDLAKLALQKGHKKFIKHLKNEIEKLNSNLKFEKSKELHEYCKSFEKIFEMLNTTNYPNSPTKTMMQKDIWILTLNKKMLFLFKEKNTAIKKKRIFYFPLKEQNSWKDHFLSYYRNFYCPNTILINFDLNENDKRLYENFLKRWHKKDYNISLIKPKDGHFANLLKLATIHAHQEIQKQKGLAKSLKALLKLEKEPQTIDCFDISHKQGTFQVGSCVRFKNGEPDKNCFRRFKIRTIDQQDDYACLQEIVKRRYKNEVDIPDLILIDGGKGQLNSILSVLPNAEVISLAKKEETIFSTNLIEGKKLNEHNFASQILIALRDYTHHFAISYHRKLSSLRK
ncbi:excinuclease ABC subunit C [Candidatus Dependentiae bacterium]|nr:excinuclease ABC subunit C [Candidatus Dependentiae bacterium]